MRVLATIKRLREAIAANEKSRRYTLDIPTDTE
jgi:hypothetical protein